LGSSFLFFQKVHDLFSSTHISLKKSHTPAIEESLEDASGDHHIHQHRCNVDPTTAAPRGGYDQDIHLDRCQVSSIKSRTFLRLKLSFLTVIWLCAHWLNLQSASGLYCRLRYWLFFFCYCFSCKNSRKYVMSLFIENTMSAAAAIT
jgi:hypothetical protein